MDKNNSRAKAMTIEDILRVQNECRDTLRKIAKLYPGAFYANGSPLVAELRFPTKPAHTKAAPKD